MEKLLLESIIASDNIKITLPKAGFTRYLAQSKIGEPYMNSEMTCNFVFYEPYNKKVFKIFSDNLSEREELYQIWNIDIDNKDKYICQNFEFINVENQNQINDIFEYPSEELATFLQDVTAKVLLENTKYEVCIGVVHGKQLTENGVRYPHAHILLRKKAKNGNKK